ncbi:D-alanyl-D-alanine carboxypeptidase [Ruminococcaceae bacterium OttesenSCG-928-I18]|nr:D-alanyl-D-alanine carboxypeptidase [Ruminococcaceae bacterium OttesenSCG-928-I18]
MHTKRSRFFVILVAFFVCVALCPAQLVQAADAPPEVEAEAYVVMDAATGQILAEKNGHLAKFPASITKILTLGLVLEGLAAQPDKMGESVQVSYRACHELIYGATHVGLTEGEQLSVADLLYATQIESANDAANVLAEYQDGSIEGFADRMNRKSAELGLSGSHFTNPSGQPNGEHYTTAYDMAQITRWAMGVPGFREVFASTEYTIQPTNNREFAFTCRNTNSILNPGSPYYYPGVTGSKMGYTDDARYTLVTTATRGDTELICVVMHCDTNLVKYQSTIDLLDYGFGNFTPAVYPAKEIAPVTVPAYGGGTNELGEITVCGGEDIRFLLHNSLTMEDVSAECVVPESYVIGQPFDPVIRLTVNGQTAAQPMEILETPLSWTGFDELFAANTSVWERAMQQYPPAVWFIFAVVAVLVALIAGRVLYVKLRRHRRRKARLAQARAELPIRLEPRPAAKTRTAAGQSGMNRARQFGLRQGGRPPQTPYVFGTAATQPRRVGRAR